MRPTCNYKYCSVIVFDLCIGNGGSLDTYRVGVIA